MARRTQPPAPEKMSLDDMRRGVVLLRRRLAEVEQFDPYKTSDDEITALGSAIEEALERIFGRNTSDYNRYSAAARFDWGPLRITGTWTRHGREDRTPYIIEGRQKSIALLNAAIKMLEERIADEESAQALTTQPAQAPSAQYADNRKVFIVHGHDESVREAVARFLEKLGFEAIILGEKPSQGRTIIEKFEAYSDVSFAIVLLTPDDAGGTSPEDLRPRARQNVILELGYFIGKLTRERVCALVKTRDIELPSDIHGINWIYWDTSWQVLIAKELKAAGYEVDLNALT